MSVIIEQNGIQIIFKYYLPKSNREWYGEHWKRSSLLRNVQIIFKYYLPKSNREWYGKHWKRSSLLRNVQIIFKYYLPKLNREWYGKHWERSSLPRNVLSVKHYKPQKLMYSNYQIRKILENYFQIVNFLPWIKLTSVLIHLKYWCYNTPSLELPCFPRHLFQISP